MQIISKFILSVLILHDQQLWTIRTANIVNARGALFCESLFFDLIACARKRTWISSDLNRARNTNEQNEHSWSPPRPGWSMSSVTKIKPSVRFQIFGFIQRFVLNKMFTWEKSPERNCCLEFCWRKLLLKIMTQWYPWFSISGVFSGLETFYFFAMHLYQSTLIGYFPSGYQKLAF